ncbi:MAG TPA: ATP-binding protein, partial [Labilithrix sp.]|nr:ATP-binding protein [Labilithrix sp.]
MASGAGRAFVERALALVARMKVLGGAHIGWDARAVTFAFDVAMFPEVLEAACSPGGETQGAEPPWAVGMAQGPIHAVTQTGSPLLESGLLSWSPAMVTASALAALARPGEIFCCTKTLDALRAGELVTSRVRLARDGALVVRGARIDRRQPWRKTARESVGRMVEPSFVRDHLPRVHIVPGSLVLVRADPGAGGTRLLKELAARAPRALVISPVGSGFEPLGALRRAIARALKREVNSLLLELGDSLEALLAGRGVSFEMAARLLTACLWPKQSGTTSLLVVDDAKAVDPATLEACVRAVRQTPSVGLIARLDATSGLPSVLSVLPMAEEHELPPISRETAELIAMAATGGALDEIGRGRATLGGGSPLAVVEAIAAGIATGEIAWAGDKASSRSLAVGRGKVRPAAEWILERANAETEDARMLLSVVAVAGGELRVTLLSRILEEASSKLDVLEAVADLQRSRWLVVETDADSGERTVALPSRTHQKALMRILDDDAKRTVHLTISRAVPEDEGVFGRVEGAWHAAQAGEGAQASAALLDAARAAASARLDTSTTQLIAFARRADPSCETVALELLANALERAPSHAPPSLSTPRGASPEESPSSTAPLVDPAVSPA